MGSSIIHRPAYRRFCKLLRQWREGAGLTQRDLAKRLGESPSYVHKSETCERRMDALEFAKWCRACGLDPSEAILLAERV